MESYGVFLDLVYGAPSWLSIFKERAKTKKKNKIQGMQVLYVHSGGLEGVSSQLTRYKHANLVKHGDVQ